MDFCCPTRSLLRSLQTHTQVSTNRELLKCYQYWLLAKMQHLKQFSLIIHIRWKHRDPFKLNLHYFSPAEVRKNTARISRLDSVLTRTWWFAHPKIDNFRILRRQNVVMSSTHICVTGNSGAKIDSSNPVLLRKEWHARGVLSVKWQQLSKTALAEDCT